MIYYSTQNYYYKSEYKIDCKLYIHAVTGLSNTTGNLLPANNQTIDYTAFNKASHISQGNLDYFITYGPDRLRRKTQLNSGIGDDVLLTKYYAFGDYEKEVTPTGTRHLHYIPVVMALLPFMLNTAMRRIPFTLLLMTI